MLERLVSAIARVTVIAVSLVLPAQLVHAAEYSGPVVAVEDGDTFTVQTGSGNVKVRLCGVDSPERARKQRPEARASYQKAKEAMVALVHGKTVRCIQVGRRAEALFRASENSF
jgi:endonuclease YncB( thermonuclease family)